MTADRITFAGQLTRKEYRAFVRTGMPLLMKYLPVWVAVLALFVSITTSREVLVARSVDLLVLLAIVLGIVALAVVSLELGIRRSWRTNAALREPVSGAVTGEGIEWEAAFSKAMFPWHGLHGYREGGGLMMVYIDSNQALWLFPRFFNEAADWDRARDLIRSKLSRR